MMIPVKRQMAFVTMGVVLLAGLCILHVRLDQFRANIPKLQRFMYLPQAEALKTASLGFHELVSDFLWLRAIQAMGEQKVSEEAGYWIYRALDIVTTLDPMFVQAYEAGSIALCTLVVLPDQSNALLEKGMKYNPRVWQLPFYLGINYYFEFGDDAKAAESLARAARLPGAPEYIAYFAARLYALSQEPQAAIDFLAQMYEQANEENVRQALEHRLKEAIVERDLQVLERAIFRYRELHRHPPVRLEELVGPGFLIELPPDPFGGTYLYNPETQAVRSGFVDRRMPERGKRRVK